MREIKVRAWDNINNCWINIFKIVLSITGEIQFVESIEGEFYGLHQVTLEQYTGLKDKNGKEIYEGNIVRCVNGHEGLVIWEEEKGCFNVQHYYSQSDDYPIMAFFEGQPIKIIGNIHDTLQ